MLVLEVEVLVRGFQQKPKQEEVQPLIRDMLEVQEHQRVMDRVEEVQVQRIAVVLEAQD
jgi:hypothetical protein